MKKLSSLGVIQCALEAGFMISSMHGQGENKLMPASDLATLKKFLKLASKVTSEHEIEE
jgi:hypothetical protein